MPDALPFHEPPIARAAVRTLGASQIRAVANVGMGDPAVLPFWFGEPDVVTPAYIRAAAEASLARGETYYTENLGIPALRDGIAAYVGRLHGAVGPGRIAATASGMSALAIVVQALVGAGDRVVAVTPLWPNLVEIPRVLGAHVETVALTPARTGFALDLDRLLAALRPGTRALFSTRRTTRPDGRSATTSRRRSSRIAGGTASGSSPTTSTSACGTATIAPPRRRSSRAPRRTIASSAPTASRRPGR